MNSVLPGPVLTGRRQSYLEHWAPLHGMTVPEAAEKFPKEAGIAPHWAAPRQARDAAAGRSSRPPHL